MEKAAEVKPVAIVKGSDFIIDLTTKAGKEMVTLLIKAMLNYGPGEPEDKLKLYEDMKSILADDYPQSLVINP